MAITMKGLKTSLSNTRKKIGMGYRKVKPKAKKLVKKTKKILKKGGKYGHRINNNFKEYLESDRRNAMRYRIRGKVTL